MEEFVARCSDCGKPLVVKSSNYLAGVATTNWYYCLYCEKNEGESVKNGRERKK